VATLLLVVLLAAPQKGIIPLDIVEVGRLEFGTRKGGPDAALKTWIDAHRLHKEGKLPEACGNYIAFLGMAGHRSLPARYAELASDRVDALHEPVRKRFEASCKTYKTDRNAGVVIWKDIAGKWPMLPEGKAALQLWQSDALREAIDVAKRLRDEGRKKEAPGPLEKAVRSLPHGLYRYEATSLLVEVGGPDLRTKKKRKPDKSDEPKPKDPDDGDSEIEIND
jgi:hypothetical protein